MSDLTDQESKNRKKNLLESLKAPFKRYFVEPFASSTNPPWFDARGAAVGLAVGFGVPVGGQVIMLGLLRIVFRFNSLIAFALTWVTNPVTFVPMYYGYYRFGSWILGSSSVMTEETFRHLISPVLEGGYFWESLHSFVLLGWEFLLRWLTAAAVIAPTAAILGYFLSLFIQRMRCKRKAEKMGVSYEILLKDFEDRLKKDAAPQA